LLKIRAGKPQHIRRFDADVIFGLRRALADQIIAIQKAM